jgi:tRNA(fMet)-specific endonuclease VapC
LVTLCYLLDTNAAGHAMNVPSGAIARRILGAGEDCVAISTIVAGEIMFGLAKNPTPALLARIDGFLQRIAVIPLERDVAAAYAETRADLERRGRPIGANDLWIAAHARALDLTLITANTGEFSRVKGLSVENWLET